MLVTNISFTLKGQGLWLMCYAWVQIATTHHNHFKLCFSLYSWTKQGRWLTWMQGERALIGNNWPAGLQEIMGRFVCVHIPQRSHLGANKHVLQIWAAAKSQLEAHPLLASWKQRWSWYRLLSSWFWPETLTETENTWLNLSAGAGWTSTLEKEMKEGAGLLTCFCESSMMDLSVSDEKPRRW